METNVQKNYKTIRENFMETYKNNPVLSKMIPEVAAQLLYDEFGINVTDHSHIPIVFTAVWKEILKFVGEQPSDEFSIDICGISLEYVTEISESDKSTNIVPQLIHKRIPIFSKHEHREVEGSVHNEDLLNKYNTWRTVNLMETLDRIEANVFQECLQDFGVNLMRSPAVIPIMAAAYVAGIQLARETKQTINMYNIFEIDVVEGDKILLTPLATVKQYLKNDSKK